MSRHKHLALVVAIILSVSAGCTKKETPPAHEAPLPAEPLLKPTATTLTVLEKTFTLKTSSTFPFDVPAHSSQPHLHGIFQSFAGQAHGPSDDTANIDFVVLNEVQQADVSAGRPGEAMFTVEGAHNQSVNFDLPPAMNQPVKYYLVFRNAQGSKSNKVVEAHFRVDF